MSKRLVPTTEISGSYSDRVVEMDLLRTGTAVLGAALVEQEAFAVTVTIGPFSGAAPVESVFALAYTGSRSHPRPA
jgi:hypothetical protein